MNERGKKRKRGVEKEGKRKKTEIEILFYQCSKYSLPMYIIMQYSVEFAIVLEGNETGA